MFSYALLFLLLLFVVMMFWRRFPKRSRMMHVPLVLLAVYLAVASVFTSGGYVYNQHHLFVLPALFACVVFLIHRLHETWDQPVTRIASVTLVILLCVASFTIPPDHYREPFVFDEGTYPEKVFAAEVDRLLDDCDIDQYAYIGLNGHKIFGYTTHSPMGPLLVQYDYFFQESSAQTDRVADRVRSYRREFLSMLDMADIIVYDSHQSLGNFKDTVDAYIHQYFSETPWECSTAPPRDSNLRIYYRSLSSSFTG